MKAIIVYQSLWGNTAAIARAIAAGIGPDARSLSTTEASGEAIAHADLIVAGAPVLGFTLPSDSSRALPLHRAGAVRPPPRRRAGKGQALGRRARAGAGVTRVYKAGNAMSKMEANVGTAAGTWQSLYRVGGTAALIIVALGPALDQGATLAARMISVTFSLPTRRTNVPTRGPLSVPNSTW